MRILRELLFRPHARFSDLNPDDLGSDQLTYHIKELEKEGLLEKQNKEYSLTAKGKEYANRMDTENAQVEKQPKVGVLIIAEQDGKLLRQTRLKHPYYGFMGMVSGKVRYGDTVEDTARRELQEETGLLAAKIEVKFVLHEHVYSTEGELLEDKLFHVIHATELSGELIDTKEGANEWVDADKFVESDKAFYDEEDILEWFNDPEVHFIEKTYIIDSF